MAKKKVNRVMLNPPEGWRVARSSSARIPAIVNDRGDRIVAPGYKSLPYVRISTGRRGSGFFSSVRSAMSSARTARTGKKVMQVSKGLLVTATGLVAARVGRTAAWTLYAPTAADRRKMHALQPATVAFVREAIKGRDPLACVSSAKAARVALARWELGLTERMARAEREG